MTFPEWIVPMAATLTEERFTGPEWSFEQKLDGIRLLAFKQGADVRLFSRSRLPQHVPAIAAAIARMPVEEAIFDGELLWDQSAYHVFDLPWVAGRDLRGLPLEERRLELGKLPFTRPLFRVMPLDHPAPWDRAKEEGWEGVIAKRRGSLYESRRSPHWLKMKCELTEALVVVGFTDPRGTRVGLGALLVAHRDGDELVFAGKVGTGLDTKELVELRARLDVLEIPAPPFTRGTGLPRLGAHWVRPEVIVEVAFLEWTNNEKLRHPRILGVRP